MRNETKMKQKSTIMEQAVVHQRSLNDTWIKISMLLDRQERLKTISNSDRNIIFQDPCNECGDTLREQYRKSCNKITCYKGR